MHDNDIEAGCFGVPLSDWPFFGRKIGDLSTRQAINSLLYLSSTNILLLQAADGVDISLHARFCAWPCRSNVLRTMQDLKERGVQCMDGYLSRQTWTEFI